MLKVDQDWLARVEATYPGFRSLVEESEAMQLPPCPRCGSDDTAEVSAGLVGVSIHLTAATTKIRLLANGHPADYCCNRCKSYFNEGHEQDDEPQLKPGGVTIPGVVAVEALKTPEGARALYEDICHSLGIEPVWSEPEDLDTSGASQTEDEGDQG